jgi:tetratricopeptide (TPR) repeat protein
MSELIRAYQNRVAGEISRLEGHIAQYIGDGVLAYFGWPRAHEDDAERAVRAGLAITAATSLLKSPSAQPLQTRIGIATGVVVVGDLMDEGVTKRHAVVGDTPNLAARLQGIAQPGMVVIAEATRRLAGDLFVLRELGTQSLKGIPEPTPAFAVLAERSLESRFAAKHVGEVTPIIGRDQELALLVERWRQAKSGEGQVVLLSGEAGIGKSRLTEALIDAATGEPHFLLRYQCSPYHTDSALYPVIQQLAHAAGLTEGDSADRRLDRIEAMLSRASDDVGGAMPLIAALLGIDASSRYRDLTLTPQERRNRTFAALIDQLTGLAGHEPVLWVVEDAQWIDPTTLELIELTLRRLQGSRVLALVTSRPTFIAPFRDHPVVTMLALDRLNRAGTQAIVTLIARGKGLPDALLDKVAAATDGVPLFVEEITKALLESGMLRETATSWQLEAPLAHLTIPMSLHDSLMARLDRLRSVAKEIAQTAAVIGRTFDYVTLAHLSLSPASELSDALGQLVEAELIFCDGKMPDARYRFKHALVRDAAYESLLKTSRRTLHLRLLDVFETGGSAAPEILAHHAHEGGDTRKAAGYWQQAAEAASRRYAHQEAAALYAAALEVADALAPEARASMLEACAWENLVSDEVTVSVTRYEQALEIWTALGRTLDQGRVLSRLSRSYGFRCRGEESHRVCHDAVALLQAYPDSREYLEALCEVSRVEMSAEHPLVAIEAGSRALTLAEQRGDERLMTQLLNNIGMSRYMLGEVADGRALLERSLAIGRKNRDQDAIGRFYILMNGLLYDQRRYKECEQLAEECAKEFPVGGDA